jgi:hypothetical protein
MNNNGIQGKLHLVGVVGNRMVERLLEVAGLMDRFTIHTEILDPSRGLDPV